MDKNRTKDPLPETFSSLEEAAEFWDAHSLGDYWDETRPVDVEVRAVRRHRVPVASELFQGLLEVSQREGVSVETLVNLWLAERLRAAS
jgi:hypothetical protein